MLKLKLQYLGHLMQKTNTGKDPDAGQDWRQKEKGMTEDEMVGWHHQLDGHGFGWALIVGDGQGGLACCGSWGGKELDPTEWLNWTEQNPLQYPAWVNPCTEESGELQSMVSQELDSTEIHTSQLRELCIHLCFLSSIPLHKLFSSFLAPFFVTHPQLLASL